MHLGDLDRLDFGDWCRGLAAGRSYVSDGYAHALQFSVNDIAAAEQTAAQETFHVAINEFRRRGSEAKGP